MSRIQEALEKLAIRKSKKINEKYAGDKSAYLDKVFYSFLVMMGGKEWKKDDITRVYLNQFNMFYDCETKAFEKIHGGDMDFPGYEEKMIKLIDSE